MPIKELDLIHRGLLSLLHMNPDLGPFDLRSHPVVQGVVFQNKLLTDKDAVELLDRERVSFHAGLGWSPEGVGGVG